MKRPTLNVIDEVFIKNDAFLLATLGSESRRKFTEAVEVLGLGWQSQNIITSLHTVASYTTFSQRQLADSVGVDPRNLVPIIDDLEQRRMIERVPDSIDRRGYKIKLTASGTEMAERVRTIRTNLENEMLSSLLISERKALHGLLQKLWEHSDMSGGFRAFSKSAHGEKNLSLMKGRVEDEPGN